LEGKKMGMLFNTDDTIAMLRIVNLAFNQAGLSRIRNDKTTTAPTAQTFTTLGSVVATYTAVAKPLGIDFDAGSGLRSIRWQKWLGYLDSIQQPSTMKSVSNYIGNAISIAITSKSPIYSQVEFFVVPTPASAKVPTISALAQDFQDVNGEYSKIITITTSTVDQLLSASSIAPQVQGEDDGAGGDGGRDRDGDGDGDRGVEGDGT
jgi:hypothetical protein